MIISHFVEKSKDYKSTARAKSTLPSSLTSSTSSAYYDDGSYSIVTIIEHPTGSLRSVKEGSKIYEHIVSGNTVWTYTINASFSYNGSSSSCTSVSDSYTISNSNWHLNSRYHWKSGNTAYGSVTMDKKILGITADSVTRDLTLSCSANGTLS